MVNNHFYNYMARCVRYFPSIYKQFCVDNSRDAIVRELHHRYSRGASVMLDFAREHTANEAAQREAYSKLCVTLDLLNSFHRSNRGNADATRPILAVKYSALHMRPEYLNNLVIRARHRGIVDITVDAEQTTIQEEINVRVLELQKTHHTRGSPFRIFHTYQAYLIDSYARLQRDVESFAREGTPFACKLVRGAYFAEERRENRGHALYQRKEDTDANYRKCLDYLIEHDSRPNVIVATHNEADILHVSERKAKGKGQERIGFALLKGMNEGLVDRLTQRGFPVHVYTPFGKMDDVLPYLIRRLHEKYRAD